MTLKARLAPPGSRRRALAKRVLRREPPPPGNTLAEEREALKHTWERHRAEDLEEYLVSGYQNPRINAQSILARHFLIDKIFGSRFDDLKQAELEFCVEANAALRQRAGELGVSMQVHIDPAKRARVAEVSQVIADRQTRFEQRWAQTLAGETAEPVKVLELACGSANDYRFFDSYGIAGFLDYTGIDLNETNIVNALQHYPDVNFEVGSILDLPYADDSFDYVLAFDIFEHLSLAAMHQALGEAKRVARQGIVIAFFIMVNAPEHNERIKGSYHWNELSAPRIRDELATDFSSVRMHHIPAFLKKNYGATHSYNKKAWTIIAER